MQILTADDITVTLSEYPLNAGASADITTEDPDVLRSLNLLATLKGVSLGSLVVNAVQIYSKALDGGELYLPKLSGSALEKCNQIATYAVVHYYNSNAGSLKVH